MGRGRGAATQLSPPAPLLPQSHNGLQPSALSRDQLEALMSFWSPEQEPGMWAPSQMGLAWGPEACGAGCCVASASSSLLSWTMME
jgi:hypothetical protein